MSPPRTASADSSPPLPQAAAANAAIATESTPPKSPVSEQHSSSTASSPASATLTSPLPPLPIEVFLLVLKFLDVNTKLSLRLMSRAWFTFLTAQPSLWSDLTIRIPSTTDEYLHLRTQLAHVAKSKKPGSGGIKRLVVMLQSRQHPNHPSGQLIDLVHPREALNHLDDVYARLLATSASQPANSDQDNDEVGSAIRDFEMYCQPNTLSAWHMIRTVQSYQWLLRNASRIKLYANLSGMSIDHDLLSLWPNASSIELLFRPYQRSWWHVPPNFNALGDMTHQETPDQVNVLARLEYLHLRELAILPNLHLPAMPRLHTIELAECTWTGTAFFTLLRLCRRTLRELKLFNFDIAECDENDSYADHVEHVLSQDPALYDYGRDIPNPLDIETQPAPIVMRRLETLIVHGETTPGFWASRDNVGRLEPWPRPFVGMPVLRRAELRDLYVEPDEGDDYGSVAVFGRLAPRVQHLDLECSNVGDGSLFHCLRENQNTVVHLNLHGTEVTDKIIIHLDSLAPSLQQLVVSCCASVTNQGVARALQRMRDNNGHRLEWVSVDAPNRRDTEEEWRAWQWLAFHGVLYRSEADPEGDGPRASSERLAWKRYGKTSDEAQWSGAWREEHEKEDVVQTVLNPPDSYKTSVLSGLTPPLILDIASRAMNFYTYQVQQEGAFQALILKNAQERVAVLEAQLSTITTEAKHKISLLEERVARADKELELERRKVREQQEMHKSNAKAYNKLKAQYDKAKQKALVNPVENGQAVTGNIPGPFTSANATATRQPFAAVGESSTPARSASNAGSAFGSASGAGMLNPPGRMTWIAAGAGGASHTPSHGRPEGFVTADNFQHAGVPPGSRHKSTRRQDGHSGSHFVNSFGKNDFGLTGTAAFGAGGGAFGVAPMPVGAVGQFRQGTAGRGEGRARSAGSSNSGSGHDGRPRHRQGVPEYLGQPTPHHGNLGSARKQPAPGLFRPAGVGHH
ncbi:hypothetical protein ACM66B_000985 [Microbotryomycetes sp. NB124-2]